MFERSVFEGLADFPCSEFEELASFAGVAFEKNAQFQLSEFHGEARFSLAAFKGKTDFSSAVFKDFVTFSAEHGSGGFGSGAECDFRDARFQAPRKVSFHGLTLRPYWFLKVDPREFEFVDVDWIENLKHAFITKEVDELKTRERVETRKELEKLKTEAVKDAQVDSKRLNRENARPYRLLSIACRQLAVNAEENHRYDQASDFRFWSMELQRKEGWRARGRLPVGILHTLYRYLSGYGEEIGRAFLILVGVCLLLAVLYTWVGFVPPQPAAPQATSHKTDEVGIPQKPAKALAYSLAVITLQRPDPRPLTASAWFAGLAETILGPIQAALAILAVRRRFMR